MVVTASLLYDLLNNLNKGRFLTEVNNGVRNPRKGPHKPQNQRLEFAKEVRTIHDLSQRLNESLP